MLNSTKTLEEKFDEMSEIEEFWGLPYDHLVDKAVKQFISDLIAQTREETLKEIIREYQDNELDGKGYDFYFSIRAKIDELNKLKK